MEICGLEGWSAGNEINVCAVARILPIFFDSRRPWFCSSVCYMYDTISVPSIKNFLSWWETRICDLVWLFLFRRDVDWRCEDLGCFFFKRQYMESVSEIEMISVRVDFDSDIVFGWSCAVAMSWRVCSFRCIYWSWYKRHGIMKGFPRFIWWISAVVTYWIFFGIGRLMNLSLFFISLGRGSDQVLLQNCQRE